MRLFTLQGALAPSDMIQVQLFLASLCRFVVACLNVYRIWLHKALTWYFLLLAQCDFSGISTFLPSLILLQHLAEVAKILPDHQQVCELSASLVIGSAYFWKPKYQYIERELSTGSLYFAMTLPAGSPALAGCGSGLPWLHTNRLFEAGEKNRFPSLYRWIW